LVSATALIFIVLLFGLMWVLFIQPQRRRQRAQQQMLDEVGPGDEILTAGGLYGTVRAIDDDELILELAPGIEVRLAKRAVAAVLPPDGVDADEPGAVEDEPEGSEAAADAAAEERR
jgi:preprotein translocase subunit YajC